MIKVVFVCLGNICRSPMAEGIFRDLVEQEGLGHHFVIDSAATSDWEHGNPVHPGTVEVLSRLNISSGDMFSRPLGRQDADADYLIGMDESNLINIERINIHSPQAIVEKLLQYTGNSGDIADPYYTGDFEQTYRDVLVGCEGFLQYLIEKHGLQPKKI